MKILHQDSRNNAIKLLPETIDDLWHMYNLVDESDLVLAMSFRRKEEKFDKLRPERTEKARMKLGIRVKKVEFHETDDRLRVLGSIESGPQDIGEHHTLMIAPGDALTIVKPSWQHKHFERIKRAVSSSEKPSIFFVAIEDTEAVVAAARDYGFKQYANITRNPSGKMYSSKSDEADFLVEVAEKLVPYVHGEPVIVLGPGFTKEALAKVLREKYPELSENLSVVSTGQAGMAGVHELMKKGIGGKLMEGLQVARETRLVERLFTEIAKDGMFAYGDDSVRVAIDSGAVEMLLILDEKVRSPHVDSLIRSVEDSRGEFAIVSSLHEAGRRLESLGGIAAILRYRMG
ncbi:MAG: mRNA surveillance protein pelota [Thermoplasmata archaeon]|nr:mRNA surveillance protein pelota [Thermoplasmata archaeon]